MFGFLILDQYWWFALPGLILGLYAQFKLTGTYNKYIEVPTRSGLSGAEAAREILDSAGLRDVPVEEVGGRLTDHYDPAKRALFLSSDNYRGRTVAAVGVAAHESGHALQHQAAYAPLNLRMALVPITGFASQAVAWIFLLGWFMSFAKLVWPAIIAFGVLTVFQVVTLPVEYDASHRAKVQLARLGLVGGEEGEAVNRVLNAAALTYVAALVETVFTLLHFLLIARNQRD
jgi:uncharacterized protein